MSTQQSGGGSAIHATEESERKYTATPDQPLPDLSGVARVASIDVDTVELSAQYYDTSDLRLLRSKITLRRREGGDDAGWHLKLPAGLDTRTELHFPLGTSGNGHGPDRPPAELLGLLRGIRRNRPVALAALLSTTRNRRRLRDSEGALLAEVVVDDVTAVRGPDDIELQWREVEVELGDGGTASGSELLDAVEAQLATAGITRSPSPSKLHRVLGDLMPVLPEATGAAGYLRDYLVKELHLLELADVAVRRQAPESIHSMRKAARRIRSALQTYADDVELDDTLVDELRWLGRRLSPARDLEVQWERLTDRVADIPIESQREATKARIDEYFSAKSDAARIESIEALDSERYVELLAGIDALIDQLSVAPSKHRKRAGLRPEKLVQSIGSVAKKVSKRVARVGDAEDPVERDERMHRARKGAKRMRYAIEVIAPLHPGRTDRALGRFDSFQDLLGEFQDSVVAREHLVDMVSEQHHAAESSFGLGILYRLESEIGAQQAAHLERAWRKALRAARKLWD
ncbi:CYTH and CHAD domain-containing protein [Rhodococcus chondri]|uniref:CYTH and CHAD domain-containing protein n=1 Tax=Rhodococcus chondri TaxID=3065941 RepID=A0ABU7JVC1_9NOCA|nr:CYTH and CHAD domain-containing protein [Rhodococcus sp. CC-R104]MEE2033960.1 CYTH and CHAD domain-containing protein [Rhodococcus sp. CC-R104]